MSTVHEFEARSLEGRPVSLGEYAGKVMLVVNTASKCGFTPQYEGLEAIYEKYRDRGLVVLGFPCNQFGEQEPGSHEEIGAFCQKNYGVSFPMFEKVDVNGDHAHPLYRWLKEKTGHEPTWNFCKYLVKPDGTLKFFASKVQPLDKEIVNAL